MQKGQVAAIAVMLVAAIIGLVVFAELANGFCNCLSADDISKTLLVNVWNNDTCDGTKCDTGYAVTCNDTQLVVGDEYDIDDCNVMLTNATWNETVCTLSYAHEADYYAGDSILGTIVCLLPLLVAMGILVFAIAWAAL